ncbi:ABC transporter substrate-binding protein [Deinococcus yavapaiensis]|uniref:Amino acid ABC transporter substrate-binding protein (PAAT family) n=1 Tax=Deinococcus yavapaiensis KR-236 TaxID=694435 RepID=A0A318SAC2_9DEIO|nr:ABC transporter substrate-binding protein [Deinococcus yavapaiensis]PYE53478.1 amino acid ABC transporter substrate-binding protein (PAAT family) [Deinococcus yavapaiensis KR-236]
MKHATLLALALLCTAQAAPRTLAQIQASGTLRLGTEGAFPPFNYFESKKLVGFEVDLGNALAKAMNLKAEWQTLPFDNLLIALNQGRFDYVIASHAITPERQKAVDFAKPHYCSTVNIVAKVGGPLDRKALAGKTVGAQVGTAQLPILRAVPGIKDVLTYPNDQVALTALQSGRVDAWSSNGPVVAYMLKQAKLQNSIKIGEVISNERNASAVAKGNTALRSAIDAALDKLMKDGTYAKLSNKWFGQDIRCK